MSPLPRSLSLPTARPHLPTGGSEKVLGTAIAWGSAGREGVEAPPRKSGQETERDSFLLPGSGDIDGLPKVSVCAVSSLDTPPCTPTPAPSPRKPCSPSAGRSPPLLSLQNSPNNISGISNPPGTPRDDGELGGNFLHSFQNDNVSVPAAPWSSLDRHPVPGVGDFTVSEPPSCRDLPTGPGPSSLVVGLASLPPSCVP